MIDPLRNLRRRLKSKGVKGLMRVAKKLPGHQISLLKVKKLAVGGPFDDEDEFEEEEPELDEEEEGLLPDDEDLELPDEQDDLGELPDEEPARVGELTVGEDLSPADQMKREIVVAAMQAVRGQHPNPEEAIQEFIEEFGEEEFQELREMVLGQEQEMEPAKGRLIEGPGAGQEDKIPGTTPGGSPVVLSDGEYVIDAPTVAALGDGSNKAGASRLDMLRKEIRKQAYGHGQQAKPMKHGGRNLLSSIRK